MRVTLRPAPSNRAPIDAAAMPFPREDNTPPVTKIYFTLDLERVREFNEGPFGLLGLLFVEPLLHLFHVFRTIHTNGVSLNFQNADGNSVRQNP